MTPTEAKVSSKNLNNELFNLTPSALVTLYEIDVSDLYYSDDYFQNSSEPIFRFHNEQKLFNNIIVWNGNSYYPVPIATDGFQYSARGSLPTPRISITIQDNTAPEVIRLKNYLRSNNELAGAKLTRRRTFAKFLDAVNWDLIGGTPNGFAPDPNSELVPDIYLFSRKSADNKSYLEYELTSVIDLDGTKLPNRLVLADRCPFVYRGEGCLYEYDSTDGGTNFMRRDEIVHGSSNDSRLGVNGKAPPIANYKDELFIGTTDSILPPSITSIIDKGSYSPSQQYEVGDCFYITKNHIKYYFVVKFRPPIGTPPPNTNYYEQDECSHTVKGCRLRYSKANNILPFGGYPSVNKAGGRF